MEDDFSKWFCIFLSLSVVSAGAVGVSDYQHRGVIGVEAAKNGLVQDWRGHWVLPESKAEESN